MNKRVIQVCISLLGGFIVGFCIVKLVFPELLIAQVTKPKITSIGNFIDDHLIAKLFMDTILAVIAMHFYLSSCVRKWSLKPWHYFILAKYGVSLSLCYMWNPVIAMCLDLVLFIVFPLLLKSSPKQFIPLFIVHQVGQTALLFIRSQPLYMVGTNYAAKLILVMDAYAWLLLYYLYCSMNKEVTIWECLRFRFSAICQKLSLKKNLKK